ncbi:MAG TPA: TfoX/Sxy family protein [Nitrososphaerales archaeon]|nr:TfoX/Sxy family protein [Nitrososphaerales archaeon]
MKIPRSTKESEAFLRSLVPDRPEVSVRPMFGNLSAFVNGNMYAGVFGDDLFVRLSEEDAAALLKVKGAGPFEPMKGRAMKGYIVVPREWRNDPARVKPWVSKALARTGKMPAKAKKRQP